MDSTSNYLIQNINKIFLVKLNLNVEILTFLYTFSILTGFIGKNESLLKEL